VELAIRTIDCGIVAMAATGYGGPSPTNQLLLLLFVNSKHIDGSIVINADGKHGSSTHW